MANPLDPNDLLNKPPAAPNPYGETSVEKRVESIAGKDSGLNQMARTEAAKVMNRRGMLNTAMTTGAATDAVLKNAVPIASQDASQAFQGEENRLSREATTAGQIREQTFTKGEAELDRLQRIKEQNADIAFRKLEGKLDRASSEKLASWQLKSGDRNAAAQFLTNMESMYQSSYQSIMNNTALSATARTQQLTAAKKMRDRQLNFVEQMYNIDLRWIVVMFLLPSAYKLGFGVAAAISLVT